MKTAKKKKTMTVQEWRKQRSKAKADLDALQEAAFYQMLELFEIESMIA